MKKIIYIVLSVILIVLIYLTFLTTKEIDKYESLVISEVITSMTVEDKEFSIYEKDLKKAGIPKVVIEEIHSFYNSLQDENFVLTIDDILLNMYIRDVDAYITDFPEGTVLDLSNLQTISVEEFLKYEHFSKDGLMHYCLLSGIENRSERLKNSYFKYSFDNIEFIDENQILITCMNGKRNKNIKVLLTHDIFKNIKDISISYEIIR